MGDRTVVERDVDEKPPIDALVDAGVSRAHIVLAYAGESADEAA